MIFVPTLQAKYWIDRKRCLILIGPIGSCHEEWASSRDTTLEALLDGGWIRIQFIPPIYLYIDHRQPASRPQFGTLKAMIDQAGCKIVVEFNGRILIETTDPLEALRNVPAE